jgi:CspA family cold shock protein
MQIGQDMGTALGRVKWYSKVKGYGFLILEDGREVFYHFSNVNQERQALEDGEPVTCTIRKGDKGLYGCDIRSVVT